MIRLNLLAATALMMTLSASAHGQSRPGAAVDDSRTVLPRTATPFAGQIGQTWQQSRPDFPKPLVAPEGAPNVLLILTDDTGFGHASTFGGGAATPVLEQLARDGLRYNRFHTTALCSPTRAALLTGRNHHSVGTGVIMEMATGYPGYTGIVPNSAVGVPEILRLNGYATGCFGKWHNTPATEVSAAGPFERWPTGSTWGCDTFYGFMAGETDQYYPVLYRNTTPLNPPRTPEQGYSFSEDMADETIAWINNVGATDPKKPWFIYLATPGCMNLTRRQRSIATNTKASSTRAGTSIARRHSHGRNGLASSRLTPSSRRFRRKFPHGKVSRKTRRKSMRG